MCRWRGRWIGLLPHSPGRGCVRGPDRGGSSYYLDMSPERSRDRCRASDYGTRLPGDLRIQRFSQQVSYSPAGPEQPGRHCYQRRRRRLLADPGTRLRTDQPRKRFQVQREKELTKRRRDLLPRRVRFSSQPPGLIRAVIAGLGRAAL
jgi:hypothetical protein